MTLSVDIRKQLGSFSLESRFTVRDGEPLALLGASGCGKSVTLRCIAGILTPDEGRIVLDGNTLYDSAARINLPPQKRRVGYLFQQYALFPNMTVRQNIAAAVRERSGQAAVVSELLHRFQLESVAGQRPGQLSGGQQQRCALARILASSPRAILLDEPFSALDSYLKYQLELELTETMERFAGPVVWVSHDRGEVLRNCKTVCVIDRGHSQPVANVDELFRHPGTVAAARLSGCKNFSEALPHGTSVFLPVWNLTLPCGQPVPETVTCVGLRAHQLHPAEADAENSFSCTVLRVIPDVFQTIVLLHPDNAPQDVPPLRMELPSDGTSSISAGDALSIAIDPQDILLLH